MRGSTAADTGGGISEAVATLSGDTAIVRLARAVGDKPDEVTLIHAKRKHNSSTGERIVEDTKTKTGLVHLGEEEKNSAAKGRNSADGSLKDTITLLVEAREVSVDLSVITAEVTRIISEKILFESLVDTTDYGTTSMGGGVPSKGSDTSAT